MKRNLHSAMQRCVLRPSALPHCRLQARAFLALFGIATAIWPALAIGGQLTVTDYSFSVAPSSNYANQNLTVLTNGTAQVTVWPGTADTAQLVGWFDTNPGIQFNFTGGQSVSEVTVWAANSKGSAGIWLPQTLTFTSGTYSKTLTVTPPAGSGTTTPLTITGLSAAASTFTITADRYTASSPNGWTMFSEVQFFGTGAKAANTDALGLATSWTGAQAPVSTDIVLFNNTFTSATTLDTGTAADWSGLKVTGGSATLTIDPSSTANRLGIGSGGIDLSGATRDVRLTDLRLTSGQTWSIAGGRSLMVGGDSLSQAANANPVISGSGTLVKEGAGTGLTLGSLTTFTGTLSIQAGSVATSAAKQLTGNYSVSLASGGTLQLGGNETLPTAMNTGIGTIEILGSNRLTISNAASRSVDRVFSGTGGLTKTGTGVLTLSGSSSYSGGTLIAGGAGTNGILRLGSNSAIGTGTVTISGSNAGSGGTLDLNGATITNTIVIQGLGSGVGDAGSLQNSNTSTTAVVNGSVVLGGGNYVGGDGSITFNGVVSGGTNIYYSLFKQGAGTWTFANAANTFDGFYYQIGGVTEVTKLANQGQASSLGQTAAAQNSFSFGYNGSGGGTLRFIGSDASTSDRSFLLSGTTAGTSNVIEANGTSATATLTLTGNLTANRAAAYTAVLTGSNAGVNAYAGVIGNGLAGGSVALTKDGATTWALSGANTYTGATTVSTGTLKVGNGGSVGGLGSGGVSVASGATLAFDRSDAGLVVGNVISGSGSVMQIGTGTTSLTGANTYTSTTQISAGTLRIGNGSTTGSLGSGSVSIAAGAALALNRSDAVAVANAISGAGAVVKQAANTLTLSGSSTYSGGTLLQAGTLVVGGDQALGTGAVTFAAAGVTLQTNRNVSNTIAVDAAGTLATGASSVALSGNLVGGGTLTKTGTGTLTLSGTASTFTGSLVISGGAGANSIVRSASASAFGTGTVTIQGGGGNTGSTFDLNGTSLDNALVIGAGNSGVNNTGALQNTNASSRAVLNGAVSLGGEIYVGGVGDITFNGLISGGVNPANPYSVYKDGAGTWTYANTANTFDGFYYQVGGVTEVTKLAKLNETSSLGQATTAARNKVSFGFNGSGGGTLRFIGGTASTSDREFVLAGGTAASSSTIEASGTTAAATLTLTGGLSANRVGSYSAALGGSHAGVNEYRGVIGNGSGTVSLVKDGSTTWALTGTNTYTGATSINGGTLSLGSAGALGTTGTISFTGGTVQFTNANTTDYSSRFSTAAGQQYSIDTNGQNVSLASALTSSGGSFTKLGSGNLTLSGSNSYDGTTDVLAGSLLVNGDQSASTGAVTVASAGLLGGSGILGGATTVYGTLSPGNSPGVIELASLVLDASSTTVMEILGESRGTTYDGIDIASPNGLTYGGSLSLAFGSQAFADGTTFDLFNFTGITSGTYANVFSSGFYAGAWADNGDGSFSLTQGPQRITFAQSTGDVMVMAVPEPGTLAILSAGLAAAGLAKWRRKRRPGLAGWRVRRDAPQHPHGRPRRKGCSSQSRSRRSCASDSRQFVSERCTPPDRGSFQPLCRP